MQCMRPSHVVWVEGNLNCRGGWCVCACVRARLCPDASATLPSVPHGTHTHRLRMVVSCLCPTRVSIWGPLVQTAGDITAYDPVYRRGVGCLAEPCFLHKRESVVQSQAECSSEPTQVFTGLAQPLQAPLNQLTNKPCHIPEHHNSRQSNNRQAGVARQRQAWGPRAATNTL